MHVVPGARISAALLVTATVVAGCRSPAPRSAAPSPSPTAFTLVELSQHPCRALNAKDHSELHVTGGTAGENQGGAKTCHWESSDGKVDFTSFPSDDATEGPASQPTARKFRLAGYRAVVAPSSVAATVQCSLGVAIGKNRSIFLVVDPQPGRLTDLCDVSTAFAAAIIRHLR